MVHYNSKFRNPLTELTIKVGSTQTTPTLKKSVEEIDALCLLAVEEIGLPNDTLLDEAYCEGALCDQNHLPVIAEVNE